MVWKDIRHYLAFGNQVLHTLRGEEVIKSALNFHGWIGPGEAWIAGMFLSPHIYQIKNVCQIKHLFVEWQLFFIMKERPPMSLSKSLKAQLKSPPSNTFSFANWSNTAVDKSPRNWICWAWSFGAYIFKKISFEPSTTDSVEINLPFLSEIICSIVTSSLVFNNIITPRCVLTHGLRKFYRILPPHSDSHKFKVCFEVRFL